MKKSTKRFLLFSTASIILLCYFCFYILNTIFYPNLNKYKKKQPKMDPIIPGNKEIFSIQKPEPEVLFY